MLRYTISNKIIKLQKKYRKNKIHVSTLSGKRNFVMYSYRYMKRPTLYRDLLYNVIKQAFINLRKINDQYRRMISLKTAYSLSEQSDLYSTRKTCARPCRITYTFMKQTKDC